MFQLSAAAAIALLPLLQPVPQGGEVARIRGDSLPLGSGIVRSWVEVDADGVPVAVGVTLPDSVIASVSDERSAMLSLELPAVDGLPFRHVLFDWGPGGHPPAGLYDVPHWDAHFYLITPERRRAIEQGETSLRPDPRYLPDGFVPVPELGLHAFPEMGVHWVHRDASELHGDPFDQTVIYGSDGESTIFIEPMFTRAFLADRPDVSAPIPQPSAVRREGYYPTRYVIRHAARERGFRISLEGFRWREGG
ncbi:MAG: hypothetical protein ACOC9N_03470 [Gemmatimonadota bacterium]